MPEPSLPPSSLRPAPQLSLHTPLGALTLSEDNGALVSLDWGWGRDQDETALLRRAREQLHAYFDGVLRRFELPLVPAGSAYQQRVWAALCEIPFGATRSYADIARLVGGSPRSVGQANALNPLPLVVPCHRVVGSRSTGGYSGAGGLDSKRQLLDLEAAVLAGDPANGAGTGLASGQAFGCAGRGSSLSEVA